ncbi:unnamed protein product [Cuscuta epithymum]|uniref:Uncharacterized protein n=1 Tax=Cuscuta epithymum TaxID=186058 RepID=A0AAV0GB49_9ASTE|nr:unnamed protein product [Cuscuta epithymum]
MPMASLASIVSSRSTSHQILNFVFNSPIDLSRVNPLHLCPALGLDLRQIDNNPCPSLMTSKPEFGNRFLREQGSKGMTAMKMTVSGGFATSSERGELHGFRADQKMIDNGRSIIVVPRIRPPNEPPP